MNKITQHKNMYNHSPRHTPQTIDTTPQGMESVAYPTKDNPELIPLADDGVRYLVGIPRKDGSTTGMYEHERYFDENGTEHVVMQGVDPEAVDSKGRQLFPQKTYSRESLNMIKDEARARRESALAKRAAMQAGIVVAEAAQPSLAEFDDNGMIKMPDSVKNIADQQDAKVSDDAQKLPEQREDESKSPEQELRNTFWARHAALLEGADDAIERAGYIDSSVLANNIARDIESIRQISGLNPAMADYLKRVINLCEEVSDAGRDTRSPYHNNGRAGLQKIKGMISALKKS